MKMQRSCQTFTHPLHGNFEGCQSWHGAAREIFVRRPQCIPSPVAGAWPWRLARRTGARHNRRRKGVERQGTAGVRRRRPYMPLRLAADGVKQRSVSLAPAQTPKIHAGRSGCKPGGYSGDGRRQAALRRPGGDESSGMDLDSSRRF